MTYFLTHEQTLVSKRFSLTCLGSVSLVCVRLLRVRVKMCLPLCIWLGALSCVSWFDDHLIKTLLLTIYYLLPIFSVKILVFRNLVIFYVDERRYNIHDPRTLIYILLKAHYLKIETSVFNAILFVYYVKASSMILLLAALYWSYTERTLCPTNDTLKRAIGILVNGHFYAFLLTRIDWYPSENGRGSM